jgi:hypothetical protein
MRAQSWQEGGYDGPPGSLGHFRENLTHRASYRRAISAASNIPPRLYVTSVDRTVQSLAGAPKTI